MVAIRILIVGLGSIGRRHARNLLALGETDLLFLRRAMEPVPEAPHIPVFTDLDSALAERPDLVVVASPAVHHVRTALRAARAGAHLFIEKPLSNSLEGVGDLKRAIASHGVVAMVGFDLRFEEGLNRARTLLEEGRIGTVLAAYAEVGQYLPDWRPSRDYRETVTARSDMGGGVITELCHELDYVDWLAGPIEEVACIAGKVSDLEIDVEDTAEIIGRSARGCLVSIHLDCVQREPFRQCKLIGSEGTIIVDLLHSEVRSIRAEEGRWEVWHHAQSRDERFREQMQHVLACVRGSEEPRVPLARGIEVLDLTMAAKTANETGLRCRVGRKE